MSNLKISDRFVKSFLTETLVQKGLENAEKARQTLLQKTGQGKEFLGWVDLPSQTSSEDLQRIRKAAETIQSHSQYLVVVGIGGSYLGARAVIEALTPEFSAQELHKKYSKDYLCRTSFGCGLSFKTIGLLREQRVFCKCHF